MDGIAAVDKKSRRRRALSFSGRKGAQTSLSALGTPVFRAYWYGIVGWKTALLLSSINSHQDLAILPVNPSYMICLCKIRPDS